MSEHIIYFKSCLWLKKITNIFVILKYYKNILY